MNRRWLVWLTPIPILIFTWIMFVSIPGKRVEGCLDGCAVLDSVDDGILRLISLNMLHGFPRFETLDSRLRLIAQEIIRLDPDIVLLQEVPWTLTLGNAVEFLASETGMNYAYVRANGNRWAIAFEEGEAILSRLPLKNPTFSVLQPKSSFFENRVILHVTVEVEMGRVGFYVTHLTHRDDEVNQEQTEILRSLVDTKDVQFSVVAGDFNALPHSPQILGLRSEWVDTFNNTIDLQEGNTCCIKSINQETAHLDKRIDYVFVVPGVSTPPHILADLVFNEPYRRDEGWLWVSDHAGWMVDIGAIP